MHIVMTGATSGFGAEAARLLAGAGHTLTIGARRSAAVPESLPATVHGLDLDDMASVDAFARAVIAGPPIDALVLNAGIQLAKPETGAGGMERTFAVNHLAHFRLLQHLLPHLAAGTRVVLTGSGTHDPAEKTPVTPPVHADAIRLAYPERDPTLPKGARQRAFRAYSSSKLANIMTARELARRRPDLSAIAYDPGYVPWTGLGRANGPVIAFLASLIIPRVMAGDRSSTIAVSGKWLAALATDPAYAGSRGDYWSVRAPALKLVAPSILACDEAACAKLWEDSLALITA